MLNIQLQLVLILLSVCVTGYIIHLIRKEVIELKYSVVWIFVGVGMLVISIAPQTVGLISHVMGIGLPVNALFLVAIIFIFVILMILMIAISKLSMRCSRLTQSIALLKESMNEPQKRKRRPR